MNDQDRQQQPPDDDWLESLASVDTFAPPQAEGEVDERPVEWTEWEAQTQSSPPCRPLPGSLVAARIRQAEHEEAERQLELQVEDQRAVGAVTIEGTITRIKHSGEDFFVIAELRVRDREEPVPVKGALAGITEWAEVRLTGKWTTHPRYGRQFDFTEGEILLPSDTKGAERFLVMHLPSVGPGRARRIVDAFGTGPDGLDGLWRVLDATPERLAEIPGITLDVIPEIAREYRESRALRDQEVWLRQLEIGPRRATKILARYREQTRVVLEADPYVVMDLKGMGFKLADDLAKRIGVSNDHPGRARAALLHVLEEAATGEGHTFLPQEELLARTDDLSVPAERVLEMIDLLASADGGLRLVVEGEPGPQRIVAQAGLADAEQRIADQILGRLHMARGARADAPAPAVPATPSARGPQFDREQKLPALGKRAWNRSGRDASAALDALAPPPVTSPKATPITSPAARTQNSLGALDAGAIAAALGAGRRAR